MGFPRTFFITLFCVCVLPRDFINSISIAHVYFSTYILYPLYILLLYNKILYLYIYLYFPDMAVFKVLRFCCRRPAIQTCWYPGHRICTAAKITRVTTQRTIHRHTRVTPFRRPAAIPPHPPPHRPPITIAAATITTVLPSPEAMLLVMLTTMSCWQIVLLQRCCQRRIVWAAVFALLSHLWTLNLRRKLIPPTISSTIVF